jgi:predicted nucleotidyltransferase
MMSNIFNDDFRDFINELNTARVRYILVGGFAVILNGYSRSTGDMDIWVDRTFENYEKIKLAFLNFGMPVFDMTEDNFLKHPIWDVFTFGVPPSAIDIMLKVKGLVFDECYENAVDFEDDGLFIKTLYLDQLIAAKTAAARRKDLDDIENLRRLK